MPIVGRQYGGMKASNSRRLSIIQRILARHTAMRWNMVRLTMGCSREVRELVVIIAEPLKVVGEPADGE